MLSKTLLYAACVEPLSDPGLYEKVYRLTTPRRREKTDRFRFEKDRRLSLGAEALLRYALGENGIEPLPGHFEYSKEGKPFFPGKPVCFNLSHSGEYVLCAVSGKDVGCDIEQCRPIDLKVAQRFSPEEYEDIAAQADEHARTELFYRYWVMKESFMKCTGRGFSLPLDSFRVIPGENARVIQRVSDQVFFFREYDAIPGYRCALCALDDCRDAELRLVDLSSVLY